MASFTPELHAATPPVLPPKPGSHDVSRIGTPSTGSLDTRPAPGAGSQQWAQVAPPAALPPQIPDPGDQWLPEILRDKSKQDLADILSNPTLLHALTHSPATAHPSLLASHHALHVTLAENMALASRVGEAETRVSHQRAATQAQLLATHGLERQWRAKQSDMDHALAPFAPASLYMRLGQGVQEQAAVCQALEESFMEGEGETTEREVGDWIRRYREAKVLLYLRQERKERWDEGRVGGWR